MRCGLLLMIFLLAGCAASPAPTTPALSFVQLPEGAFPRFPFVAPDGAVWCSESSGEAIARIGADGAVSHVRIPGSSNSPAGIVQGPDGQIWFSGFELIGRISPSGELTGWRTGGQGPSIGLPDAITVGPNGAVWYTNDAESKSINSISPSGDIIRLPVPITDPDAQLSGITTGPDRALWFTVTSTVKSGAHFIGRMPIDGEKYQLWPVPGDASASGRIVAGPDGALWFTTTDGIGQMTVKGNFTDHPLPDGSRPFDIAVGTDQAIWFSNDHGTIGSITTSGKITLHPLAGATSLIGIAAAPDGSLWVAEGDNDKIWHYKPAA